jgi:hypothetical protein
MHARRTAVLAVTVLGTLGLAACGSSTSAPSTTAATPPTTGANPPTTGATGSTATTSVPSGPAATTSTLCGDLTDLSKEEEGLVSAEQTATNPSGSLPALQSYARQAKSSLDQTGTKITAELASSPTIVQSAWSTLQPQLDQLFESAVTSTSLPAFARAASSIQAANSFLASNQTLTAFTKATCPVRSTP